MKHIFLLVAGFTCLVHVACAQKFKKSGIGAFGASQWYVGLQMGANFSNPHPIVSYSEFSVNSLDGGGIEKQYHKRFKNSGKQIGLKTAFSPFRSVNVSLSGLYFDYAYGYTNTFGWQDQESPENALELNYDHEHHITYLEFPLVARYYLVPKGKIKPHVQAGFYYGLMLNAHKEVTESGIDRASGGQVAFSQPAYATFITPLYVKSQMGYLLGGGLTYRVGTLNMTLDVHHKKGLNSITNTKNRYSETRQILGFGNVQDDLKLNNLEISFSLMFPLKFLTKDFKPIVL